MEERKQSNHQHEFRDRVSVWVGTFPDQAAFDAYFAETMDEDEQLTCPFWQDTGIGTTDPDFQEADFRPVATDPVTLLVGFSWSDTYRDAVLQACRDRGITQVNAIALLFEYEYAADIPPVSPYLIYLGAYPYATGGAPFRRNG